jgi:hypothetical protein
VTKRRPPARPIAAWAAAVAALAGAASCGDRAQPLDSFFPESPNLAASPLATEHYNGDAALPFELLLDQGIREVADASDIYVVRTTRYPLTGLDAGVLASLDERVAALARGDRRVWERHRGLFATASGSAPIAEGILPERTPALKVPWLAKGDPDAIVLGDLLTTLTTLVETRSDVPVDRVHTRRGTWIQDYFIPFGEGVLGVPPHLEPAAYHAAIRSIQARARDFTLGGTSFTMQRPIDETLRDLAARGSRFQPLRAFVEGGNAIFATGGDGRLRAIVGRHTLLLTAHIYGLGERAARQLIADDFHLPVDHVIVIPQPDYHIDLYLRAGAAGAVFVASQAAGKQLLEQLLIGGPAESGERAALEALRERVHRVAASPVGRELGRNLEAIRGLLRVAGFEVIDYPSFYYSYIQTGEYVRSGGGWAMAEDARSYVHINTLNNRYVTTSDGRVLDFVLATGYAALDRRFEVLERRHGAHEVYFLGQRQAAPRFWGNRILVAAAGIGCLTNF